MPTNPTQEASYWVDSFKITQDDIDHLYSILLERELPLSVDEMALIVVRFRFELEIDLATKRVAPSNAYKPSAHYEIGDEIVLTAINSQRAVVAEIRKGDNPEYGDFNVITVEANGNRYDLAADLQTDHVLNESLDQDIEEDDLEITPEDVFIEYGGEVAGALEQRLSNQDDLVRLAGRWFPRSLLADVTQGHLNLAEAVLDMANGGPMDTNQIVEQIGIMAEFNDRLAEFSLNYGLQRDDRFDEVGPAGKVLWYLRRLEPPEVLVPPPILSFAEEAYDPKALTPELRDLEIEIGDEHTDIPIQKVKPQLVNLLLTYPHKRAGTLPLSHQLRLMFPTAYEAPRIRFTLIDGETADEMPAWVVRTGGYVYGLSDWFKRHEVPIGGYLTVTKTTDPSRVKIGFSQRKSRMEWVKTAIVSNHKLIFENRKLAVGSDYDELMMLSVEDPDATDELGKLHLDKRTSLQTIVEDICRELVKLNPQGAVHAKTIYSAVNLLRRCPPGPIFVAALTSDRLDSVGSAYWKLKESHSS